MVVLIRVASEKSLMGIGLEGSVEDETEYRFNWKYIPRI